MRTSARLIDVDRMGLYREPRNPESATAMSTGQVVLATLVVLLGAGGTYLLLPHRHGARASHGPRRRSGAGEPGPAGFPAHSGARPARFWPGSSSISSASAPSSAPC